MYRKEYRKQWRQDNREKCKKYNRLYYLRNHKKFKARNKQYHEIHREEMKESSKQYYKAHREEKKEYDKQYREAHKEEIKEYHKQYCKRNFSKRRGHHHKRRAILKDAGIYTLEEWKVLCEFFGNKCLACGKSECTVDHVIPLSKGGSNSIDNLQPLCHSCNSRKRTKIIDYRKEFQDG